MSAGGRAAVRLSDGIAGLLLPSREGTTPFGIPVHTARFPLAARFANTGLESASVEPFAQRTSGLAACVCGETARRAILNLT